MCGRYLLRRDARDWIKNTLSAFDRTLDHSWPDRYNVPPDRRGQVPVVRLGNNGQPELVLMHWAYVPHWVRDAKPRQCSLARAENIALNGYFHDAFQRRRALLPVSGFYEWDQKTDPRQPYVIHQADYEPFFLGAIWDNWRGEPGLAVITTEANRWLQPVHHRMPLIISAAAAEQWLSSDDPRQFLHPHPFANLLVRPVGHRINNARNDSEQLLEPL